jgi:hypothetical protein
MAELIGKKITINENGHVIDCIVLDHDPITGFVELEKSGGETRIVPISDCIMSEKS